MSGLTTVVHGFSYRTLNNGVDNDLRGHDHRLVLSKSMLTDVDGAVTQDRGGRGRRQRGRWRASESEAGREVTQQPE